MSEFHSLRREGQLGKEVAERLSLRGYDVVLNPARELLPFDMGGFAPDLVAFGQDGENLVVEVLESPQRTSVERLQTIAENVSSNPGWRLLVISPDDVAQLDPSDLLSVAEIRNRIDSARRSKGIVDDESQFLYLWPALEALLRRLALDAKIPIENRPIRAIMDHLYSLGVVSRTQYHALKELFDERNRTVHGYRSEDASAANARLLGLLSDLLAQVEMTYA